MTDFFKSLLFLSLSCVFILGCNDDNDDIVKPEDVANVDLEKGIVFGLVDRQCAAITRNVDDCNRIFRYTKEEIFKTDVLENIPNSGTWTFENTSLGPVALVFSRGLENLPRGLRDFESKSISEFVLNDLQENSNNFYIFEYETPAGRKTIQFENIPNSASEEVKLYFTQMIRAVDRL